ncbi:collagen alpha-3(VI) chain-like isoform X2 [Amblyraja radiata]|uniref:collagen alpha-3(VI) chain-like isoform X2 n=1 Tax=Amblyraja radiata TaxID=386614 RepID=UPI001401FBF8|nr:collagen alpha-3(VI) chain-like isoform X2 [Amblyraja radiata]
MKRFVSLLIELGLVLLYFVTETEQAQESADIVFLIDGSNKVERAEFQLIHSFIANIVEDLNIGASAIQTAVVQYSNVPSTEFYLKAYNTKRRILKAMQHLHQNGGHDANVGLALQFLMDNHFVAEAGSRAAEKVPQVMILITSRQSTDDIKSAVFLLKKLGTFIFVVGVKDADADEMKKIATDPSFTILLPDIRQMASARTQLMPLLSLVAKKQLVIEVQESKVEAQVSKRDIIFLIDGSSSVGHESFLEMVKFISNIVNKFVIGSDSVQVAVVQSSDDHNLTEWYLNTHTTQSALQSALTRLRMNGDREVYTGAALDYVFKKHFTRAAGSRKEDGIPQLLVVITGERSVDDVKVPVDALKRAAVMTIAIGVKNADQAQIKDIAIDPSLLFYVDRFQDLHGIRERVMAPLSTLAGVTITYDQPTEPSIKEVDKKDIVFLVDGSYSRKRRKLPIIQSFITKTIEAFDIGSDAVQVGLVQYSDRAKPEFFLNTYSSKDEMLSHVRKLRQRGGTVLKTGEALKYVLKYIFNKYSGSRHEEGVPQFLVLITGGKLNDDVKQISDALSRAGIKTLAIGFENATMQQLQEVTLDANLVFDMKDLRSVPEVQQKVLLSLSTLNKPTQTSGLPISPTIKENAETQERDIVFLIDDSWRAAASFDSIREFLYNIIKQLNIGEDRNRVAVVQYSEKARVEFPLDAYTDKGDLLAAVQRLRPAGGSAVNTGAAMKHVVEKIFATAAGRRRADGTPQILVLLTCSKSTDDVKEAADALKRAPIVTFVIGVPDSDRQELQEIAYSPNLLFEVQDFKSLPEIQEQLLQPLTTLIIKIITMPRGVTEGHKRDIVFLIDGSSHVGIYFYLIRDFIVNLIPHFDIGKDKDQISVVQYSGDTRVEFPLNALTNTEDALAAVKMLRQKGGNELRTGAALDFVRKNVFSKSGGGRKHLGSSQILLLVTSRKSQDDVWQPSEQLKQAGVVALVVGIGDVEGSELRQIAYSPSLSFRVDNYMGLSDLDLHMLTVSQSTENVPIPLTIGSGVDRRDIVFLIDGSAKLGKGFKVVRKFMAKIVEGFDVGVGKVQFGVVQFSENPRTEFFLNSHATKKKVMVAIKKLKLKRGKKINIGQALDHVMHEVFTSSAGSRIGNAIPQILVLLTCGKSNDDISQQADKLRKLGIVLFGIGLKEADEMVLEPLAYSPALAFPVKSTKGLVNIQHQLQQIMKTVAVEVVE